MATKSLQRNCTKRRNRTVQEIGSAIKIPEHIEDSVPQNYDYRIYLAGVYGWKKNYLGAITTHGAYGRSSVMGREL